MAKSTRINVLLLAIEETIIASLYGCAGFLITVFGGYLLSTITGETTELFGSVLHALIGCFAAFVTGVFITGYRYLEEEKRKETFLQYAVQGIVGLLLGCLISGFYYTAGEVLTHYSALQWIPFATPVLGLLVGFNHRIGRGYSPGS
jgi:hypothetical protein